MTTVRTSIATLFAIVSIGGTVTAAQLSNSGQEKLTVPIGSIFEIQVASSTPASASWVLTQNGDFVESSRDQVFRTRFSREGTYSLAAQVTTATSTIERLFTLDVRAKRPEDTLAANGPGGVVSIDPAPQNNRIAVSASRQVVTVTPIKNNINVLAIDLNTQVDSDGDGNTENDEDTKNTLFRSEGNPLRIWFVNGTQRTIRFGALIQGEDPVFQTMQIGGDGNRPTVPTNPSEPSLPVQTNTDMKILVLKSDNGEVQYALRKPAEFTEPLLLLWDFGDGSQSMLDRPIHTYPESGKYNVNVQVRNLRTGVVIETVQDSIMINRLQEEPDPSQPTDPKDPEKETDGGGSILGLVFKLILSLIGFAALGALIMFVVGKAKNKGFSLEKTMEKAEQTMVKTPTESTADNPPPMEITAEEVDTPDPPAEPEVPQVEPTPEPEPEPEPEPTPPPPPPEPTPEPPAPEPQAEVEAAPNVSHDAMQPSAEELQADVTNAPDWLQSGIQKAEAEGQTPDAPPPPTLQDTPVQPPEPEAPPTPPAEEPTPEPASTMDTEKEAAEKERKRRKRQRYRENLKKRKQEVDTQQSNEQEGNSDEPVAYIRAEDIEPMEETTTEEPPKEG